MIRALTQADLIAASQLHEDSFDKPWSAEVLAPHLDKDLCLGLFQADTLAGFIINTVTDDQSEIITIAVAPKQRGQGVGRKLLDSAHASLKDKGVEVIFLEVAIDNEAAQHLYKTLGYEPFGTRPAYYKRPEGRVAATLFRKHLVP